MWVCSADAAAAAAAFATGSTLGFGFATGHKLAVLAATGDAQLTRLPRSLLLAGGASELAAACRKAACRVVPRSFKLLAGGAGAGASSCLLVVPRSFATGRKLAGLRRGRAEAERATAAAAAARSVSGPNIARAAVPTKRSAAEAAGRGFGSSGTGRKQGRAAAEMGAGRLIKPLAKAQAASSASCQLYLASGWSKASCSKLKLAATLKID